MTLKHNISNKNKVCGKILLIEDDVNMALLFQEYLKDEGHEIIHCKNGSDGIDALKKDSPDLVLLDLSLPDMDGFDILKIVSEDYIDIATVIITGKGSMNTAVEAMQLGARDFIVKPCSKDRLVCTVNNMLEQQELKEIVDVYRKKIDRSNYCDFIGSSLSMQGVYQIIDSAARSKATVFITGESGTGKELCAEATHRQSPRSKKPFCAINCGAIPRDLMESEIFGHVKGAFTGAHSDREGAARRANSGTLFLDEICEMDLDLQTKLLRFIQTETYQKVGGSREEKADVRFVCATNKDPLEEVNAGRFREDLYYRLHVLPIHMPPLRERDNDILKIADTFLRNFSQEENKKFERFSSEVEQIFKIYNWPGNVRQLQNVVRNIVVLNDGDIVTINMLPAPLSQISPDHVCTITPAKFEGVQKDIKSDVARMSVIDTNGSSPEEIIKPMEQLEREAIEHAISICDGNVPQAAHHLGVSSATIYRKKSAWKKNEAKAIN